MDDRTDLTARQVTSSVEGQLGAGLGPLTVILTLKGQRHHVLGPESAFVRATWRNQQPIFIQAHGEIACQPRDEPVLVESARRVAEILG